MIERLKVLLSNLFGKKKQGADASSDKSSDTKKAGKTVKRIRRLKEEITSLKAGYDKSIAELDSDYRKHVFHYNKAYVNYQEAFSKHNKKMIDDTELKQARKVLSTYEESVNDAEEELEKVKEYRKKDILNIINQIDKLKEKYTDSIAKDLEKASNHFQEIRKEYLSGIASMGEMFQEIMETDKLIQDNLKESGFKYDNKISEMIQMKTNDLPMKMEHLSINPEDVKEALQRQK